MISRVTAVTLGLIAGVAAFLLLFDHWTEALALAGFDPAHSAIALAGRSPRLAWTLCGAVAVFASASLLVLLGAGLFETVATRRRIALLRHDPAFAGRWNAADWRAIFVNTAIADRAESLIAAITPASAGGADRRVLIDMQVLTTLDRVWLDRLTLDRMIAPLPLLTLGFCATLALLRAGEGGGWEMILAAGAAGWLVISFFRYVVRLALMPAIAASVGAATAAIRPLTPIESLDPERTRPAGAAGLSGVMPVARIAQADLDALTAALAGALTQPLAGIAEALKGAIQQREQAIDSALAEVRAGIERLLAEWPGGGD